jgi:hypothetical protein
MTVMPAASRDHERRLLSEIGTVASRARDLRRTDAVGNHAEIHLLTADLQVKWKEIRALRAEPVSGDVLWRSRGGSHR